MGFENRLKEFCEQVTEKLNVFPNKIICSESKGSTEKNKDEIISFFVQIFEQSYPFDKSNPGTASSILRITAKNPTEVFITSHSLANHVNGFCVQSNVVVKESFNKKDGSFQNASYRFVDTDDIYFEFIEMCVKFSLENYISTAGKFGCCGRYKECSETKKCIHPNKLYSTICEYRKHLEKGEVFY